MRMRFLFTAVAAGSVFLSISATAEVGHEVVFIADMPATGFPVGATIAAVDANFRRPMVNRRGHVVISGVAAGGGVLSANDNGIWLATRSGLIPMLREGDPISAISPAVFVRSGWTVLAFSNDDGLLVQAGLSGDVSVANDTALLWLQSGAPIEVIAREGDAAGPLPEDGAWTMFTVNSGGFDDLGNSRGDALIQANTTTTSGFYQAGREGVVPLLRINDPAPGLPGVSIVAPLRYQGWGDAGVGLVFANVSGGGVTADNNDVLLSVSTSGNAIVLREGDALPGIAGAVIGGFSASVQSTRVVDGTFTARATLRGVPADANDCLLLVSGSLLDVVMREGEAIPGAPVGAEFSAPFWEDAGPATLAFAANGYPGGTSTWLHTSGELVALTRPGDPAPEFGAGVEFQGVSSLGNDGPVRPSRFGRVAIMTRLEGIAAPGNNVVYQRDVLGQLRRVVQFGEPFDTPLGDSRALTMLNNMSVTPEGLIAMNVFLGTGSPGVLLARVGCPEPVCGARDLDGDCVVGIQDLAELLASFGGAGIDLPGDLDMDGDVDLVDLAEVLASFGADCRS